MFQSMLVSFKLNKNQQFCIFFIETLQMSFMLLGMASTLSKLFFYHDLKTWIQYHSQLLHRKMEALDKVNFKCTTIRLSALSWLQGWRFLVSMLQFDSTCKRFLLITICVEQLILLKLPEIIWKSSVLLS